MAAHEQSAIMMGQVPQSMEEAIYRLEAKLQRPLNTEELTRVSTMYARIDGARASILKGVCKGRVMPEMGGGFESAIAGCRAKAWTIVRQKILNAEARRLRTKTNALEHDVRQAQELLKEMGKLQKVMSVEEDRESLGDGDVESRASIESGGSVVGHASGDEEEGGVRGDEVPNCDVRVSEGPRAPLTKRTRLL